MRQSDAAKYIQKYIQERQLQIVPSRINRWVVFEHQGKQLGIDQSSGVWIRGTELEDWRCVCKPCNTSGAIQAVEFLTKE